MHQVEAIRKVLERDSSLTPQIHISSESSGVVWLPPNRGVWSLNCDASVKSNGRVAGCGGVLRDHLGRFVFAFAHRLHPCSVLEAELRGIMHGITIAWNRGFSRLEINCDSVEAIDLLSGLKVSNDSLMGLVRGIHEVGEGDMMVNWRKVDRCSNHVADLLASFGSNCSGNMVIFDVIPDFLVLALNRDGLGLTGSSIR